MKQCSRCCVEKDDSEFTVKCRKTGRLQSMCRACKSEYNVHNYKSNKARRISLKNTKRDEYKLEYFNYLMTLSCTDCGLKDHRVIEFDHLRDKSYNIGTKAGNMPLSTLMLEIEKFEPVCANCHKIRTSTRGNYYKLLRA